MNQQTSDQAGTNSLLDSYTAASTNTASAETSGMNSSAMTTASANVTSNTNSTGTSQKAGQIIIGVFGSRSNAENAVNALRQQGFTTEEINIISKQGKNKGNDTDSEDDILDGTLTGSTLGGIGGLLLGAGALAIPGIGPIIAAGPIAGAISGAIAGGITGGLIDWGIPANESQHYEQEVVQGSILALVRTDAAKVNSVAQILRQNGAKEVKNHSK